MSESSAHFESQEGSLRKQALDLMKSKGLADREALEAYEAWQVLEKSKAEAQNTAEANIICALNEVEFLIEAGAYTEAEQAIHDIGDSIFCQRDEDYIQQLYALQERINTIIRQNTPEE